MTQNIISRMSRLQNYRTIRGGRMFKLKGQVVSCPSLGTTLSTGILSSGVSALALSSALLLAPGMAVAGGCAETAVGSGVWECSGEATGGDTTQSPTPAAGGALTVTTETDFGITTTSGDAIYLENNIGDTDISFDDQKYSEIQGQGHGVFANNYGTGSLSITTTGTVTGATGHGIRADIFGTGGGDLTIKAAVVTGGDPLLLSGENIGGIDTSNSGTGSTSITTSGLVTGYWHGINNSGTGAYSGDVTIDVVDVTALRAAGIILFNDGTGASSVTVTGTATGVNEAVFVSTSVNGTDITINVNNAYSTGGVGNEEGIVARNHGTGTTEVTVTGTVIGGQEGIYVWSQGTSIDIKTGAGTITGGWEGIYASNVLYDHSHATSMYITTGTGKVTGGYDGIEALNYGTAGLTITVSGDVEGETGHGINAYNSAADVTASMVINQAVGTTTTGAVDGIHANNLGGSLTINALGTSIGTANDGIHAVNNVAGTTTSTITANNATGGVNGIYVNNNPTGLQSVTVTGTVTGGTGYGIATYTTLGGMTNITLNSGATISSTAGLGIYNDAGDSTTTVNTGASVSGNIVLSNGSDNLTFAGGDFTGITLFDGGDNIDTADGWVDVLTFAGSSGAVVGANVVNWESVVIDAGSTISFSDNELTAATLMTNSSGILDASGSTFVLTGNLVNNGTVSMLDGTTGDAVTVSGDYSGTGGLLVDVDLATDATDTLVVGGDVTSGTTLVTVNDVSTGPASGNDVLIVDVAGSSVADAFALAGGPTVVGAFNYDLAMIVNDWYLTSIGLSPFTPVYEAYSHVLGGLNTLPTLQQRVGNRYWINENTAGGETYVNSHPEDAHPGWVRVEGSLAHVTPSSSETGFDYTLGQYKIQAGVDSILSERENGRVAGGINAYYGTASALISSEIGNGTIDTTGYGIGATATWYGDNGLYADAQAQYSWFDSDLTADGTSAIADNKGSGYALSLEAGKRFDYGEYTTFTPQAQLIYSAVSFDSFTGPFGEVVTLDSAETLKARVGVSIDHERTAIDENGEITNAHYYGIVNLYHDFGNGAQVDVSGTKLASVTDDWSGEIGLGSTHDWVGDNGQDYSVYAEVSALTGLTNFGDNNSFKGTVGFKMEF